VGKECRYGEAEGDNCKTVEVDKEEDGVWIRMVDHGASSGRYKEETRDEDATDCQ